MMARSKPRAMERRFAAIACVAALLTVWVFTLHPFIKKKIRLHK